MAQTVLVTYRASQTASPVKYPAEVGISVRDFLRGKGVDVASAGIIFNGAPLSDPSGTRINSACEITVTPKTLKSATAHTRKHLGLARGTA